MAMIKCPECGAEISTRASACIKCGLPMSEIYICQECSSVMFKNSGTACPRCGCPISDSDESKIDVPKPDFNVEDKQEMTEEEAEAEYIAITEKIIRRTLASNPISSGTGIWCESGNPISDRRKVAAAKVAFNIPEQDKVFLMVSGNIMSGMNETSKGFAVTSHGIFFCDDHKKKGYWLLDDFADVKLSKSLGYLKFANYEFNVSFDAGKLLNIMIALQEETLKSM